MQSRAQPITALLRGHRLHNAHGFRPRILGALKGEAA
jgi:hypothetical protein